MGGKRRIFTLKRKTKMAELPKDIYPTVRLGFLLSGWPYGKESKERRR
jgi:hypothetical protein